jgi:predicted SprT family Zn-dependent metalloprotease
MTQQRIQEVQAKVAQLIARAEELYKIKLPQVPIRFDLKGRAAGIAGYMRNRWTGENSGFYLRFNIEQMRSDTDWPHIINDTVPHEVAHTVCQAFPRLGKNHDAGWKRVCKALGGNGSRTYSAEDAPEAAARRAPFVYISTSGAQVNVTPIIHRKIQGGKVYIARQGGKLTRECQFSLASASPKQVPVASLLPKTTVPAAPVVKQPVTKAPTATRGGKPTNSSMIRARIIQARARNEPQQTVIDYGVNTLGMGAPLARKYVLGWWTKA